MQIELERFRLEYQTALQKFSAIANICDKLNQTSIGLYETSKYLITTANELKDSNDR